MVEAIRPELMAKLNKDLTDYNHTSYLVSHATLKRCSDQSYSQERGNLSKLYLLRGYAIHSATYVSAYSRDNIGKYRNAPLELAAIVAQTVDVSQYQGALQYLAFYRDQIELNADFKERLSEAYKILSAFDPGQYSKAAFIRTKGLLNIESFPSECITGDGLGTGGPSMEDWLISFWVRRFEDGTYDVLSWVLDQGILGGAAFIGDMAPKPLSSYTLKDVPRFELYDNWPY